MEADSQKDPEARLGEALERVGASDPREGYRRLMKDLRDRSEDAYQEMVREHRKTVTEPISTGGDPVRAWLEFGCKLAARLHPGRTVILTEAGRARPLEPPPSASALILHLPEDRKARALVIGMPRQVTSAQSAAVDLLVNGRIKLSQGGRDELE